MRNVLPFPEKAQKVLDALYEGVGAQDALQRTEYWRKQQGSVVCDSEENELYDRELFYLISAGLIE